MSKSIDELIEHRRQYGPLSTGLLRVYKFHRANPQVLDFLVAELWDARAQAAGRVHLLVASGTTHDGCSQRSTAPPVNPS